MNNDKNPVRRLGLDAEVYETREEMGRAAAEAVARTIVQILEKKERIRMIFAAAPSQNEFLAQLLTHPEIDFRRINAFHMDEYVGLDKAAPQGFGNFLKAHIFGLADFGSVHYLDGNAPDIEAECARYAALLAEDEIDIVCLGIGENGHIAFNDPHVAQLDDPQNVKPVQLDEVCRMQQVHDGCFERLDQVPRSALTLTVPRLCRAAHHFCVVPASAKAEAVRRTVCGPVSAQCPASALRLCPDAHLFLERDSAALL